MSKTPITLQRRLQKKARRVCQRGFVQMVRTSERWGGRRLLSLVVNGALVWDLVKRRDDWQYFKQTRALVPERFRRGSTLAHFCRMLRDWQETLALALLYDRLGMPAWQTRIRWTGTLPMGGERPVVLAFLHAGSYGVLRYWLRARRVRAATLLWTLPELVEQHGQPIRAAGDEIYGLAGTPHAFTYGGDLRAAARFLQPGRVLAMALDGRALMRLPVRYEAGECALYLNDGAVRMAKMKNALLLPVMVRREGAFRFECRFGEPVAEALVQAADPGGAMRHLAAHFWAELEKDPAGLTITSLKAFAPAGGESGSIWP